LWENEGGRGKLAILGVEAAIEASEDGLALGMMKSESVYVLLLLKEGAEGLTGAMSGEQGLKGRLFL